MVKSVVPLTEVSSPDHAYQLVAQHLFTDDFTISEEEWHANIYNQVKASAQWPQLLTAWYGRTEPVGPHTIPGLHRFPRTGWLFTNKIAL